MQPGEQPANVAFRVTRDLRLYKILGAICPAQDRDEQITFDFARQTVQNFDLFDRQFETNGLDLFLACDIGDEFINVGLCSGNRARRQVQQKGES